MGKSSTWVNSDGVGGMGWLGWLYGMGFVSVTKGVCMRVLDWLVCVCVTFIYVFWKKTFFICFSFVCWWFVGMCEDCEVGVGWWGFDLEWSGVRSGEEGLDG